MRKSILICATGLIIGLFWLSPVQAQEDSTKTTPGPSKVQPVQPYRLDFSFNELMDGKVTNTRHYSMNLTAGESNEIKIGTRVPVVSGTTPNTPTTNQYQYLDVGTNIWSALRERGEELVLLVRGEVSNLDVGTGTDRPMTPPVVRQIKISGDTLLIVGKPILIGSVDDPNSKRQFQLEVTVTKLR
jgi:hypothetical protein